jgi:hypothetical protein
VRFALGSAIATVTLTPPLVGAVSYHADSGTVRSPGGHDVTVATAHPCLRATVSRGQWAVVAPAE